MNQRTRTSPSSQQSSQTTGTQSFEKKQEQEMENRNQGSLVPETKRPGDSERSNGGAARRPAPATRAEMPRRDRGSSLLPAVSSYRERERMNKWRRYLQWNQPRL
ncbi:hypothetical protein ABZP36_018467 [Zizania latifolia]